MPHTILAQVGNSAAQGGVVKIVAKLRRAIRIEIPIGYQDETGFHMGVKSAEKGVKCRRFGSRTPVSLSRCRPPAVGCFANRSSQVKAL